jgi:hypothetical protein
MSCIRIGSGTNERIIKKKICRAKEEEYKRNWRPGKCLEMILLMKLIFSSYHGWRMRGRLRIWQRWEGGRGGGRGRARGGRPRGQKSLFALLLEQDTLGFFSFFSGKQNPWIFVSLRIRLVRSITWARSLSRS